MSRRLIFVCWNVGKHADVLSSFSLIGSPIGFQSDRLNHLIVCPLQGLPYAVSVSRLKSQFSSLHSVFSSQPITNKKAALRLLFFIYWSFSICVFSKKRKQREVIIATTVASPMPLSCTGPTTMVAPERPEMRVTAERMRFLDLV